MTDLIPRRHPAVVQRNRVRTSVRRMSPGGDEGQSGLYRPSRRSTQRPSVVMGTIVMVFHGDDGTVGRPPAALVRWVGAAFPVNSYPTDDWIKATL